MSAGKAFIDTNILIYYQRSDEIIKHKISDGVIKTFDCVISTQVLNEICNLLTKKYPTPLLDIKKYISDIINLSDLLSS